MGGGYFEANASISISISVQFQFDYMRDSWDGRLSQ